MSVSVTALIQSLNTTTRKRARPLHEGAERCRTQLPLAGRCDGCTTVLAQCSAIISAVVRRFDSDRS